HAEGVGFEPTRHFCLLVFKTSSFGRSDSPPSPTRHTREHLTDSMGYRATVSRSPLRITRASGCSRLTEHCFTECQTALDACWQPPAKVPSEGGEHARAAI